MLDLSNLNLGQLIGRALYGALARRPQPELAAAAENARREEHTRRAIEAERARQAEAARREQETELDRQRAAQQRAERQAAKEARLARQAEAAAQERKKIAKRGSRQLEIRRLLAAHPSGLRAPEVARRLGIETGLASAHLAAMVKRDVEKSGEHGRYVYRLKNTKEN